MMWLLAIAQYGTRQCIYIRMFSSGLHYETPQEIAGKTTVEVESKNANRDPLSFTGYGLNYFRFVNVSVRNSVAICGKAAFKWEVTDPLDITASSFALFYMVFPKPDIVVVGTGNSLQPLRPEVLAEIRERGLSVEVQDTPHACGTFNLLRMYKTQQVAAALIPITDSTLINIPLPKSYRTMLK